MDINKRDISNVHLAMKLAEAAAEQSKCVRSKVGSVVITKAGGMFVGMNGRLPGKDNVCEITMDDGTLVTKVDTIHAEANTLDKMHREGVPAIDCIAVQTLSPCIQCYTRMVNSGVGLIVYRDAYRDIGHLEGAENVMTYDEFCKKFS